MPRLSPDVVIMDIVMPRMNGLEATRLIRERHPDARVLILSMYDDHEYVVQIIQAGASGYVLKRVVTEDLVRAIHAVHAGESFLYPPIAAKLIGDYLRVTQGAENGTPAAGEPHHKRARGPQVDRQRQLQSGDRRSARSEPQDGGQPPRERHAQARSP